MPNNTLIDYNTKTDRLLGIYRAVVVDNKDPAFKKGLAHGAKKEQKFGRVKVFIPMLMDYEPGFGIWAYPANNSVGGRNHNQISKDSGAHPWQKFWGSCMIPAIGSYVFVFFEGGNPNRPFYFGACDIVEEQVPIENRLGENWENKWTVFRSLNGRCIVISDDPSDARTEITGRKSIDPETQPDKHVYKIEGNQKSILIDERPYLNKILIKDNHGNYINIHTEDDTIHIFCHGSIHIHTEDTLYLKTDEDINLTCKNFKLTAEENINISAGKEVKQSASDDFSIKSSSTTYIDGSSAVRLNEPGAKDPEQAEEPEEHGERNY